LAEILKKHDIILDSNIEKNQLVDNYIKYSQGNMRNIVNIIKNDHYKKYPSKVSIKTQKSIMVSFD